MNDICKNDKICFGYDDTINNFINDNLSEIIISEKINYNKNLYNLKNYRNEDDILEWLINNNKNVKITIVSDVTPEGYQFYKTFNIIGYMYIQNDNYDEI
jgi:peptide subunit release factor 1 (eRF1)